MTNIIQRAGALLIICLALAGCVGDGSPGSFTTVVIDPGHGAYDSGARSKFSSMPEKNLALDTSLRLQRKLRAAGYRTVMTRTTDVFIPLDQRVAIGNRHRSAIFVSVHYNYSRGRDSAGVETYYTTPRSASLASSIQRQLVQIPGVINRGVKTARFRVIAKSTIPSVLVECGFVTNPGEAARVNTAQYRDQLATRIARGIMGLRSGRVALMTPGVADEETAAHERSTERE